MPTTVKQPRAMNPTTMDIVYTEEQMAYLTAVQEFKQKTGRKFLTACEHLDIAASLGYRLHHVDN